MRPDKRRLYGSEEEEFVGFQQRVTVQEGKARLIVVGNGSRNVPWDLAAATSCQTSDYSANDLSRASG
jgi:hypothetical protein